MSRYYAQFINFLAVVLPLLNLWEIAKAKNMVQPISSKSIMATEPEDLVFAGILVFLLLAACKLAALLVGWYLRRISGKIPVLTRFHHSIRDSGSFYALCEILSLQHVAHILLNYPAAAWTRLSLLFSRRRRLIKYGQQSSSQKVELYLPNSKSLEEEPAVSGLILFVHGGAWGSGGPSSYALITTPFLKINWAVAIIGYRLYPEGDASTQVNDIELAVADIAKLYPTLCNGNVCLLGHSSGAHLSMLTVVERARRDLELTRLSPAAAQEIRNAQLNFDCLIGMSGPYNINDHFGFEAGRGVEQISPMSPANGHSSELFKRYSPALQLVDMASQCISDEERQVIRHAIPPITLIHGMDDHTVPHSSSEEAARLLRSVAECNEIYLEDTGHEDAILQLMLGGQVQEVLTGLLKQQ